MFYISNGALKLNTKDNGMDMLWNVCLFLIFVTATILNPRNSTFNRILQWAGYGLLVFATFAEMFSSSRKTKDVKLNIGLITVWYGVFLVFSNLSVIWAYSVDGVLHYLNALIRVFLLGFCLSQHVDTEEKLKKSMKLYIFTCMIMIGYCVIRTPKNEMFNGLLGEVTGNSVTALGLCAAFAMVMSVYFAMALGEKRYYIVAAVNFVFVVIATSRKALLFAILGAVMLELMYTWRRNYVVSVISILAVMGVFALIIMKSGISDAMNHRMLGIYYYFVDGGGKKDTSISLRWYLIMRAKSIFLEHPLVGVGLGNFSYFLDDVYGQGVYAHNNYMEIVSDLGIIGLIIYYWFYVYLFVKLLGQTLRKKKLSLLYLVLIILFMAIEFGQVTYYQHTYQFIIAFAYCAVCISDREDEPAEKEIRFKTELAES